MIRERHPLSRPADTIGGTIKKDVISYVYQIGVILGVAGNPERLPSRWRRITSGRNRVTHSSSSSGRVRRQSGWLF